MSYFGTFGTFVTHRMGSPMLLPDKQVVTLCESDCTISVQFSFRFTNPMGVERPTYLSIYSVSNQAGPCTISGVSNPWPMGLI